jgi:2'-5' RNA ligase
MRLCLFAVLLATGIFSVTPAAAEPVKRGNLFSAIPCADTPFGAAWARLLPAAQARFPGLRLTRVEDLHITVVYFGPAWKPEDLPRLRPLALTAPVAPVACTPEVVFLGANNAAVVVEQHASSPAWGEAVNAAKRELNRLGLKPPDAYDTRYRPHLTLAQAAHNPPAATDAADLAGFLAWMQTEIARDPQKFALTLGPATPVRLLLAGTARPEGEPEYITVEDFMRRPPRY